MSRDQQDNRLLLGAVGAAVLILMTMITAVFLVSRRPVVVVTGSTDSAQIPSAATVETSSDSGTSAPAEQPPPTLSVSRVEKVPALSDPLDLTWEKIAAVEIPLTAQQVAQPALEQATVSKLLVQAIRDNERYAWRISWDKPQPADLVDYAKFTDAVAIQFPLVDGAPYTMGGPNLPVRMLYWKAVWQKDVDEGFQELKKIYPNAHYDMYWFAEGTEQHSSTGSTDNPQAQQFMVASMSKNPMADYNRKKPVEEMTAHGFGSSTHVPETPSGARGVWHEGKWYVVLDRPINDRDPLIARFNAAPDQQLVAFAVWDGDHGNRGSKKQISNWIPMQLAK
ncbi:MAG: hypothetical protein KDB03_12475 [Planctomycetales bacterium]|nr:hypothetical protein [Planctomycetales bacterium]